MHKKHAAYPTDVRTDNKGEGEVRGEWVGGWVTEMHMYEYVHLVNLLAFWNWRLLYKQNTEGVRGKYGSRAETRLKTDFMVDVSVDIVLRRKTWNSSCFAIKMMPVVYNKSRKFINCGFIAPLTWVIKSGYTYKLEANLLMKLFYHFISDRSFLVANALAETHHIIFCSDGFCKMTGCKTLKN